MIYLKTTVIFDSYVKNNQKVIIVCQRWMGGVPIEYHSITDWRIPVWIRDWHSYTEKSSGINGHHERQMVGKLVGGSTRKNGKKGCLLPPCFPRILATRVHSSRFTVTVSDIHQCHPSIPTEKNGDHGDKPWDSLCVVSNKKWVGDGNKHQTNNVLDSAR